MTKKYKVQVLPDKYQLELDSLSKKIDIVIHRLFQFQTILTMVVDVMNNVGCFMVNANYQRNKKVKKKVKGKK